MKITRYCLLLLAGMCLGHLAVAAESSPPVPVRVVMTKELMQRLIKYVRAEEITGGVSGKISLIFHLSDGRKDFPLKLCQTERPEGTFLGVPLDPDSKDVIIIHRVSGSILEAYLTDPTGKLRAAAIDESQEPARLILNEQAAAKFEIAMSQLAREASEDLPPITASAPAAPSK